MYDGKTAPNALPTRPEGRRYFVIVLEIPFSCVLDIYYFFRDHALGKLKPDRNRGKAKKKRRKASLKKLKVSHSKEWRFGDATPQEVLSGLAKKVGTDITSKAFCDWLDENDKISHLRDEFVIPKMKSYPKVEIFEDEFEDCVYFCGNSLGLQPKKTPELVTKVLENWGNNAVHAYWDGTLPAAYCDKYVQESIAKLVGAYKDEVVTMNGLSVNLHLLLVSFYLPTKKRHKVMMEAKAFPSDHYAVESQIKQRGFDPETSMLLVEPAEDKDTWCTKDILSMIEKEGDSIALVLLSGVHYYSGQFFDMEAITKAAHKKGCMVGFDLAHAIGNVEIYLHEWEVDFACWCTYKYVSASPGGIAGAFLHRKHSNNKFPKFVGWWGHKEDTRMDMSNELDLSPGIQGYRVSNPPPLLVACLRASLDIFDQTNMRQLREKSFLLTGYLETLLKHYFSKETSSPYIEITSPSDFHQRGCQLSLIFSCVITKVHEEIEKRGIVCDTRKPNVMRIAPTPLYNTFSDVYRFVEVLRKVLSAL